MGVVVVVAVAMVRSGRWEGYEGAGELRRGEGGVRDGGDEGTTDGRGRLSERARRQCPAAVAQLVILE